MLLFVHLLHTLLRLTLWVLKLCFWLGGFFLINGLLDLLHRLLGFIKLASAERSVLAVLLLELCNYHVRQCASSPFQFLLLKKLFLEDLVFFVNGFICYFIRESDFSLLFIDEVVMHPLHFLEKVFIVAFLFRDNGVLVWIEPAFCKVSRLQGVRWRNL